MIEEIGSRSRLVYLLFHLVYLLFHTCYNVPFRAFALETGKLGSILSRVKPKTLKMVSAVALAKRSAIKCSAEDEMNRE